MQSDIIGRDTERDIFHPLVYSPKAHSTYAGPGQNQKPGSQSGLPTCMTGTQPPPAASQAAWQQEARIRTGARTGTQFVLKQTRGCKDDLHPRVLAVLLLIQLPANTSRKTAEEGPSIGSLALM